MAARRLPERPREDEAVFVDPAAIAGFRTHAVLAAATMYACKSGKNRIWPGTSRAIFSMEPSGVPFAADDRA
jgi:hypothetical protein